MGVMGVEVPPDALTLDRTKNRSSAFARRRGFWGRPLARLRATSIWSNSMPIGDYATSHRRCLAVTWNFLCTATFGGTTAFRPSCTDPAMGIFEIISAPLVLVKTQ